MRKRGITENLSFLTGVILAVLIAIPMFMLLFNIWQGQEMSEGSFEELVDVVNGMDLDEEREFGLFLKKKSFLISFDEEKFESGLVLKKECKTYFFAGLITPAFTVEKNEDCVGECLCVCKSKSLSDQILSDDCNHEDVICKSFSDIKFVGKCSKKDDAVFVSYNYAEEKGEFVNLNLEKKEVGGEIVVGICLEKPCIK